jgi:osmotically-inducible protein OsmY
MTRGRASRHGVGVSDIRLERAIMEALADNPHVHADEIVAETDEYGDVVLRGTVGSLLQRAEAVRTTRRVPGVRDVDDKLRVRVMGIDGPADADTEAAILDALIDDDQLHADDIDVDVQGGDVTLRGMVELPVQRDRAERVVLAVPGITGVTNKLGVWLTVSADDVAERVTDALGAVAVVGAEQVTVDVVDNDVTLSGTVASAAHREAALAAARDAPGVAAVHDHLIVSPARPATGA